MQKKTRKMKEITDSEVLADVGLQHGLEALERIVDR